MTFETPAFSRSTAIIAVAPLFAMVAVLAAQARDLAALLRPYPLLGLSGLVLALVVHYRRSPCRLQLAEDAVWVGTARHGHWVRYESIRFLQTAARNHRERLTIHTDRRKHAIELGVVDARKALRMLRERAPQASGVTAGGGAFVSSRAANAEVGARRVHRVLRWRAVGWVGLALFVGGGMVFGGSRVLADPILFVPLGALVVWGLWNAGRTMLRAVQGGSGRRR